MRLSTWHCPHLLLSAVLRRCCTCCCGARRRRVSIDISCLRGAQQQTRRTPKLLSNDGTDRRTDGRLTVAQILLRILCGQRYK